MAAVLCLIFLPLVVAAGFMLGALRGEPSLGTMLGGVVFFVLGGGVLIGAMKMARNWDGDEVPPGGVAPPRQD